MSLVTMRPTFRLQLRADLMTVRQRMESVLQQASWRNRGQLFGDYAEFHVPDQEVRYWSPHLAVHLEPESDQHS